MKTRNFANRTNAKIIQADYDYVFSQLGEFSICLTAAQIAWIQSQTDYAAYSTRWFSPTDQNISTDLIQALQADLVARLMSTLENCEDDTMFLLRQSPENNCQLEQSTDGGLTWSLAFDYSLCMQVMNDATTLERYTEPYQELEVSYDGGATWVPKPDYRTKSPIASNIYKDHSDPACQTTEQLIEWLKESLIVDDEQLLINIIAAVITFVASAFFGPVAAPAAVAIATAIVNYGIEAFQSAFADGTEYDKLRENLYCHSSPDGSWSLPSYYEIMDQIDVDHEGLAHFWIRSWFINLGYVGINNVGQMTFETTPDCSSIDCNETWCYLFDFSVNDGDWDAQALGAGAIGQYSGGQWTTTDSMNTVASPDQAVRAFIIGRTFSPTIVTSIAVNYDIVKGSFTNGALPLFNLNADGSAIRNKSYGSETNGNHTEIWNGRDEFSNIVLYIRSSLDTSAPYAWSGVAGVNTIMITGEGTNPFGTDNCP